MTATPSMPAVSLVDAAYEQIRRRILDNAWPPGHRALEQEVALALGMSRTPVREALARRKPSIAELRPLVDATRAMDKALKSDDLDAWAAADESFHAQLLELAGNRQLQATVLNYWDRAHRARMFTLRLRPKPVNSTKEHMQMLDRLSAGDAEGASRVTRAHRERANVELLTIFERFKLSQM